MTFDPGRRIGRYDVRAVLGSGGMGEVYVAHDPELDRNVAIKVLRDAADAGADRLRRFVQEARAASALNHPNVAHVYEIGTENDFRFIAMELVEGETLRDRLGRSPATIEDTLDLGSQIAAGLAAAHRAGIVHRDVKPENVMVRPDGYAKILDFGLAKLRSPDSDRAVTVAGAATVLKTEPGVTMGTLSYMAPEQISGGDVTPAADVFSLGVVLYEMLAGHRPFDGATRTDIVAAILSKSPPPLDAKRRDVPLKLQKVIEKALAKNADERYATAGEMLEELRHISREVTQEGVAGAVHPAPVHRRTLLWSLAALVIVALVSFGSWQMVRKNRERLGAELISKAESHLQRREFQQAYEAAIAASAIFPADQRVREVLTGSTVKATITSDPTAASVFLQRMGSEGRTRAGTTPLVIEHLPFGDYLIRLEKEGYTPADRPFSTMPLFLEGTDLARHTLPADLDVKLVELGRVEPGMVFVAGGEYRLRGWTRPSDRAVELDDFLIDRFEVSNRDFAEFIRDGGYRRPELWKHPFRDGDATLSFEEAMSRLRDTTTLPGPRSWSGGAPPAGLDDHPVTDITWYEAAAFAEWKGKKLPTVFQWEKAARPERSHAIGTTFPWGLAGPGVNVLERANFRDEGTMKVDSLPFGMSPWGAYHMAGNVAEWCRNPKTPGFAVRGGGWNDAMYAFGNTGGLPPFYSSPALGFRCVREISTSGRDQGEFPLDVAETVPEYRPVDDQTFEKIRERYEYPKTPLAGRIVERKETRDWTIEKIVYVVAGREVPAYLYLPKGVSPPYQVVHFGPGGDVVSGVRPLPTAIETWLGPVIRSGRAVWAVMREGYIGRPAPPNRPSTQSAEYADYAVAQLTEMRRGLDYLETRPDLDVSKLAFVASSAGTVEGILLTGLESRYRSIVLHGSSIRPAEVAVTAAANRINFAPRIAGAKLMFHGRYDETAPLATTGEPLFRLLREPKRLELYDGGHAPPFDVMIPTVQRWLDETLGPVE
jgi:eukaryotic-like serine/threonine-protein kinase